MASIIHLKIQVDDLDAVLTEFDRMRVFRSTTGSAGVFSELTDASTRIVLEQGKEEYTYKDVTGSIAYWYKVQYFNSTTGLFSEQTPAMLGDDPNVSQIMTVALLKDLYLFGVNLADSANRPFPDILFEWGIRWAIATVEKLMDIKVVPTVITDERYDYYIQDYSNWMNLNLRQYPVLSVEAIAVKWPSAPGSALTFPSDWIQLRKSTGEVNIIPGSGSISQMLVTAGGGFLPLIAGGMDFVPNIISVDYTAGFAEGQLPYDLRDMIGKLASFGPFNVAGDLIAGAGIASSAISIDGLSQSINTTSSATNAGYGSRLIQYQKELKEQIPMLQKYYKGVRCIGL